MQPARIKVGPAPPVAQHDQPVEAAIDNNDRVAAVPQRKNDEGQVDEERTAAPVSWHVSAESEWH